MDLNAVRMLVQVAEARSFTVAAGQLGLSQSGLSRAIGRLEASLGVKLLQRNTRRQRLTEAGFTNNEADVFYDKGAPKFLAADNLGVAVSP